MEEEYEEYTEHVYFDGGAFAPANEDEFVEVPSDISHDNISRPNKVEEQANESDTSLNRKLREMEAKNDTKE